MRETKNFVVRVNDASANEIGRVASAFDGMLAELAAARDRERLEQSELAKVTRLTTMGVMAASIAHEINQPLAAIVSSGNAGLRWLSSGTPDLAEVRNLLKNSSRAAIAPVKSSIAYERCSRRRGLKSLGLTSTTSSTTFFFWFKAEFRRRRYFFEPICVEIFHRC